VALSEEVERPALEAEKAHQVAVSASDQAAHAKKRDAEAARTKADAQHVVTQAAFERLQSASNAKLLHEQMKEEAVKQELARVDSAMLEAERDLKMAHVRKERAEVEAAEAKLKAVKASFDKEKVEVEAVEATVEKALARARSKAAAAKADVSRGKGYKVRDEWMEALLEGLEEAEAEAMQKEKEAEDKVEKLKSSIGGAETTLRPLRK